MLKRSDLAKQFELVVQQEIKNFQDSLNGILQSIRDLDSAHLDTKSQCFENYAVIHSQQSAIDSRLNEFENKYNERLMNQLRSMNDLSVDISLEREKVIDLEESYLAQEKRIAFFETNSHETDKCISTLEEEIKAITSLVEFDLNSTKAKIEAQLKRTQAEIMSKPSDVEVLKQEFTQRIDVHAIDVAGLMRELRALRKDLMIEGKKVEAIFMILDKMKKEAPP